MPRRLLVGIFASIIPLMCLPVSAGDESADKVVTIDWHRFRLPAEKGNDFQQARELILGCARYNIGWMDAHFQQDAARGIYVVTPPKEPRRHEHTFRAPCTIAYTLAVVLKTGSFDAEAVGVSRDECLLRTRHMLKGLALVHKSNSGATGWGDHWQSALWAALLTHGGWMLWDDLDDEAQRLLLAVVKHEADRFIAPDYRVPYWADREKIITPRDTKAEENAWNSMILHVAAAMLPDHPHNCAWRQVASELMVSAYARRSDMDDNKTVLDGKPLNEWLRGYNVRDDGAVMNHGILHPDYATSVTSNTRAFLTQSLAGKPVPETADFNAAFIYRTLVAHDWPAPPYQSPGGTIYLPGKAEIYYPNGTDWSQLNLGDYYLTDVNAHVLGWDRGLPHRAADWMRLRAEKLLAMQARHPDRRIFAPGEFDTYPQPDAAAAWMIADAFLLHWLYSADAISERGNWLAAARNGVGCCWRDR